MFKLLLDNYRGFKKTELNFSKINILIGENSSGKSSVLKFLLGLKQSLENPTEVNLKLNGEFVDLGNYEEVVYYRRKRLPLTFGFEFGEEYFDSFVSLMQEFQTYNIDDESIETTANKKITNKIKKHLKQYTKGHVKITFQLNANLGEHSTIKTIIEHETLGYLVIHQIKQSGSIHLNRLCNLEYYLNGEKGFIRNVSFSKDAFTSLVNFELIEKCNKLFGKQGEEVFYRLAYLLCVQNHIKHHINNIEYVNPITTKPERFYFKEDKKENYNVNDIKKLVNLISNNILFKEDHLGLTYLNTILNKFGIAEEIKLIEHDRLPVVGVEAKINGLWSNILDVGYGVSLQLPILFQAILSNYYLDGQTILIEQPEVHLHPALQAKFIESLIDIGSNNSYFIETHSEHIIRKLQVMVKTKKIAVDDITIHYFKRGKNKFDITSHKILDSGKLLPQFPEGFYDVSYSLVRELL